MNGMDAVIAALREHGSFVVTTHVSPEGDAIGSAVGLALALKKMGKEVEVLCKDPVPDFLEFLPCVSMIKTADTIDSPCDAVVVVDCDPPRTGLKDLADPPVRKVINIDHHVTNPKTADVYWVDPDACAAGEMVYDIIVAMGVEMDKDIATNLYTCIFTDTGSFRYTNTDVDALTKSAKLLAYGVNTWEIAENVYESKSFGRMKLLGLVLGGIEISGDGRLAWVTVKTDFYGMTGTSAEDTDGFINYPRAVKGVEVAVLFRETGPKGVKISLRSKGRVDVSALASEFGGGGHPNASGAMFEMGLEEVKALVLPKTLAWVEKSFPARG